MVRPPSGWKTGARPGTLREAQEPATIRIGYFRPGRMDIFCDVAAKPSVRTLLSRGRQRAGMLVLQGPDGDLRSGFQPELVQDVFHVQRRGSLGDNQLGAN